MSNRVYGPEVDEAIWAMLCDGKSESAILEALAAGDEELGLRPTQMPRRTYQAHRTRLIRERGEPVHQLDHSLSEADLAASLRRRLLDAAHVAISKLERAARRGELNAPTVAAFGRLCRDLDAIERSARTRAVNASSPNAAKRANAARVGGTPAPVLDRIREANPEPVPDDPPTEPGDQEGGGEARSLLASITSS